MERLNLELINKHAPYMVKANPQLDAYSFVADSGAEFSIGFMPDDLIQSDEFYELVIGNPFLEILQ